MNVKTKKALAKFLVATVVYVVAVYTTKLELDEAMKVIIKGRAR